MRQRQPRKPSSTLKQQLAGEGRHQNLASAISRAREAELRTLATRLTEDWGQELAATAESLKPDELLFLAGEISLWARDNEFSALIQIPPGTTG